MADPRQPEGINRTFADIRKGFSDFGTGTVNFLNDAVRRERAFYQGIGDYLEGRTPDYSGVLGPRRTTGTPDLSQIPRTAATSRPSTGVARRVQQNRAAAAAAQPRGGGGMGGGGTSSIQDMFSPLFQNLRNQQQQANKRYEANRQQVTNIYGQITGARSEDIPAMETAFQRLVDAASTRSAAVNTSIDASEAARLQGNQAALQSMGLEGLSTPQGDIASQIAGEAKQTNLLNSANWEGMLRTMGATAGETARSDIAGFNFAMAEDLGQLRGAREDFAQDIGQQRMQLQTQKAQATMQYQQAQQRAAAAAANAQQRAAQRSASAAQRAAAEALAGTGRAVPLVDNFVKTGLLQQESGRKVLDFMTEFWTNAQLPAGANKWTTSSAKTAALSAGKDFLTGAEKTVVQAIIDATVSK